MPLFGVSPADDDGNTASGKTPGDQKPINNKPVPPPAAQPPAPKPAEPPAEKVKAPKEKSVTVNGVLRYDGVMLNEDYQKEHGLITSPQLVELRGLIKTKIGGAFSKFQAWLRKWHKVEWYDITKTDIDSIIMMLQQHPDRIIKGEGYPMPGDK
jgi:hypothetical protein